MWLRPCGTDADSGFGRDADHDAGLQALLEKRERPIRAGVGRRLNLQQARVKCPVMMAAERQNPPARRAVQCGVASHPAMNKMSRINRQRQSAILARAARPPTAATIALE